jgi:hypothetical protein
MMTDKIDNAIANLRARDGQAYRKARAAHHRASTAYDEAAVAIGKAGEAAYTALEHYMTRALKPHRIEWRNHSRFVGHDVNGDDWTCSAHLYGEVWPQPGGDGGKYRMHMRAHIPFSLTPRDGAEFRRMVKAIKAGADAMQEAGL